MINDEPCEVFGNRLTRSQALFGAPNRGLLKPEVEKLAELLQFSRWAAGTRQHHNNVHSAGRGVHGKPAFLLPAEARQTCPFRPTQANIEVRAPP